MFGGRALGFIPLGCYKYIAPLGLVVGKCSFLQICRPAGAGILENDHCYKYIAPLGLGNEYVNIRKWENAIRQLIIG